MFKTSDIKHYTVYSEAPDGIIDTHYELRIGSEEGRYIGRVVRLNNGLRFSPYQDQISLFNVDSLVLGLETIEITGLWRYELRGAWKTIIRQIVEALNTKMENEND